VKPINITKDNKRKTTSGTKEWADHNINCIKGCPNDCRYCYAKNMAKRFGRSTNQNWKVLEINQKIVDGTFRKYDGRVMFPSSHDIVDTPESREACFTVIKKLLLAGNDILITTKPKLNIVKDIIRIFSEYKSQIQFRFTITSINDKTLLFWEPNAPLFKERFGALKYAFRKGFKTSVSIEPFLDSCPDKVVHTVSPFITESIWIGIMNYIPQKGIDEKDLQKYQDIRKNYELKRLQNIYTEYRNTPKIRFKDSIKIKLGLS
jgi:DNA repair photolyase